MKVKSLPDNHILFDPYNSVTTSFFKDGSMRVDEDSASTALEFKMIVIKKHLYKDKRNKILLPVRSNDIIIIPNSFVMDNNKICSEKVK